MRPDKHVVLLSWLEKNAKEGVNSFAGSSVVGCRLSMALLSQMATRRDQPRDGQPQTYRLVWADQCCHRVWTISVISTKRMDFLL